MPSDTTKPIVLYFDEANALHKSFTEDGPSYYFALLLALKTLGPGIFGIFLSTKSSMADFAPTAERHPSTRGDGKSTEDVLLAPFTELPFDVHPELPVTE
jgi:hypothetical protein